MKKPELIEVVGSAPRTRWIAPVIASASARSAMRSSAWEKAVTDTQSTQPETTEMLYMAFRNHVAEALRGPSAARIVRYVARDKPLRDATVDTMR
jgi:hypothetical protein